MELGQILSLIRSLIYIYVYIYLSDGKSYFVIENSYIWLKATKDRKSS